MPWKKILILVGLVGAAALIAKKVKDANEDRALWHEATTAPDLH
ncbi:MAG: DLW-39 family protein [Micromonosporaceae bacterium]